MKFQNFRRAGIPVGTRISESLKFWKKSAVFHVDF